MGALDADQLLAESSYGRPNQPRARPACPLRQPADTTALTPALNTTTTGRPSAITRTPTTPQCHQPIHPVQIGSAATVSDL